MTPVPYTLNPNSPCVRQCCLNNDDMCVGCGRLLAEITGWHHYSLAQKQEVIGRAQARLQSRGVDADSSSEQ